MGWPVGWTIPGEWNGKRYSVPLTERRASDGLAGRAHDRDGLADTLRVGGRSSGADDNEAQAGHLVAFTKSHNVSATDGERWTTDREARAMNAFDGSRTSLVLSPEADDPLLPLGLDSHRYRCCGNGVVAPVAEWIGRQLMAAL